MSTRERWPGWIYAGGEDPDYRFSLANERTYLAWVRTSLALLAAGIALEVLVVSIPPASRRVIALLLLVLGLACVLIGWMRWAASERAMRRGEPLPSLAVGPVISVGLALAAAVLIASAL